MNKLSYFIITTNFILIYLITINNADISTNQQDSYLSALQNSHQQVSNNVISTRKDFSYTPDDSSGNGYDYHQPENNYGSPDHNYGSPDHNYGSSSSYFPPSSPSSSYGPPKPIYGPPSSNYGPPSPVYGPPAQQMPIYIQEHPRDTWFWDKFKFKIDIYTIGKLLLKLIIFKKIVKFIALVGLLLIVPKLKNLMKDDDDEMENDDHDHMESRKFTTDKEKLNERINEITNFALTAIETFSRKYNDCNGRDQLWCRFQRMFNVIDTKYPYEKIVKLYLPDSESAAKEIITNEVTN